MTNNDKDNVTIGTMDVESIVSCKPEVLLRNEFDLGIVFPSWDTRSKCITSCREFFATHIVEIAYCNTGKSDAFLKNRNVVVEFAKGHSRSFDSIPASMSDMRSVCEAINAKIKDVSNGKRCALDVVIDLSTASRLYVLSTMAFGFRSGLVKSFRFFYSEGIYQPAENSQTNQELFSEGRWESIAVPGLKGSFDGGRPFSFIVSIGFEGAKTLRIVNRAEPSRVAVLIPDPGVASNYAERTKEQNAYLIKNYVSQPNGEISAEAGNLVAAIRALETASFEDISNENIVYLCCGTKPHSLALGLRALKLGTPTVLYNKPDQHAENATIPAGRYWEHSVIDRSVF